MKKALGLILNNEYSNVKYENSIFYLEKKLNFFGTKKYKQQIEEYKILEYCKIYCKNNNLNEKIDFDKNIIDILNQIEKQ